MRTQQRSISTCLLVVSFLFAGLALATGGQKIPLEVDKAGKGASGEAVVDESGPNQKVIAITVKGLKPDSLYTVWLVNMTPKMDMAGVGQPDYSFKTDGRGSALYSATIAASEIAKWQIIEIAYHPSGDPKNMDEMMGNIALKGMLHK